MMIMIITMMISNHHDDQARTICRWKCLQCFTILHVTVDNEYVNMFNMIITTMISTMNISGEENLSVEVSPVLAPGSWGEYQCKASNRLGHASATTSITGDQP